MGWFRRADAGDAQELERVKAEVQSLRDAIAAQDERRRRQAAAFPPPALGAGQAARPATDGADVGTAAEDRAETAQRLDELAARLDELSSRPTEPDPRLDELAAKLAELDQRVTAVSTELANQVSELGHDIDALAQRPPDTAGEAVIGELRDGQARLANEQARYQIAFREDLARLAEQLRRP
jgi:chromosome segregation ATPase